MGIDEWRRLGVLLLLRNGKLTFAKAAAMSKLSLWEFADLVKRHNVEWAGFTPEEIEKEENLEGHVFKVMLTPP